MEFREESSRTGPSLVSNVLVDDLNLFPSFPLPNEEGLLIVDLVTGSERISSLSAIGLFSIEVPLSSRLLRLCRG